MTAIICDRCGKFIKSGIYVSVETESQVAEGAGLVETVTKILNRPKYQDSVHLCTDCADKLMKFLDNETEEEESEGEDNEND